MISDKKAKLEVRKALENECNEHGITFNINDTNADLCTKLNQTLNN